MKTMLACLPSEGPYPLNGPPPTMAAPDQLGRFHVLDPATQDMYCASTRCLDSGGLYLGRAVRMCEVPPQDRCSSRVRLWRQAQCG